MKKLLSLLLLFIAVNSMVITENATCQWTQVASGTSTFVSMVTNNQIIIAGSSGNGYFRSSNNGTNWTHYYSLISEFLNAFIIKDNILFAGTYNNGLQVSTNFGLNWSLSYSVANGRCFVKNDSTIYYATGYNVYKTTNNGTNWALINMAGLPSAFNTYSMTLDSMNLYLGSGNIYGVYRTNITNGTWTAVNIGLTEDYVRGMDTYNKYIFAVAGGTPTKVYRSGNYGANWTLKTNGITGGLDALCISHYGSTLMLGLWNGFYVSYDSGNTWIDKTGNLSGEHIYSITNNSDYVFVGTYEPNGKVWRRPISQIVNVNNLISNNIPENYALYQNYPNPFNPVTNFEFSLPKSDHVIISVFDVTGREVRILVNEYKQAGVYQVSFDAEALSSGMYFYRMSAGDFTDVKRMIFTK